ncbi:hypothetical protein LEMLEM_LOCUS4594 [Lemmus lemmus]
MEGGHSHGNSYGHGLRTTQCSLRCKPDSWEEQAALSLQQLAPTWPTNSM